jgi:4-hydroxy-tetrahydrodipicolinate synthase
MILGMTTQPHIPHQGVWPALLTPLKADLSIDIDSFAHHAKALLDAGCTGVTPFGTTGEGPSFTVAERIAAVDGLIARGVPANRILVSTSCAALPDIVALTKHATDIGAHGCLMLPPFFLKNISDLGVIDTYRFVLGAVPSARMVLYHLPQIAYVNLTQHVVDTLVDEYPNTFIGIKDSSGNLDGSLSFAAHAKAAGLQVWVGNEPHLREMAKVGSAGAVSGVANVMPRLVQRLVSPFDANGYDKATAAQDLARVQVFIKILNDFGMAAAFKGIMAIKNNDAGWRRVRPPLVALSDEKFEQLQTVMRAFKLDEAHD